MSVRYSILSNPTEPWYQCILKGAGIKDQDRNIVVNQKLLVDFFQSIAPLLAKGKDPSNLPGSSKTKRKKRKLDDDGVSEDEEAELSGVSDLEDEVENEMSARIPPSTRGTVLVTLRDAPPYTLWYESTN